jgi:hypothetical protein
MGETGWKSHLMRLRQHIALTLLASVLLGHAAHAADLPGRYSTMVSPGTATTPPQTILLDTVTGQSWVLVQTPGPPLHWAPVRYWTPGTPPILVPLPPPAATIGGSATSLRPTSP